MQGLLKVNVPMLWLLFTQYLVLSVTDNVDLSQAAYDVYEMFHTRHSLQREAYHHPVVVAVEMMYGDYRC